MSIARVKKTYIQHHDLKKILEFKNISQAELARETMISLGVIHKGANGLYTFTEEQWNKITNYLDNKRKDK